MRKRKKIDSSTIILSSIIVIFTIIIFLSLPVLFNYKSIQNEIENKFYSNFKINLKILDDISFRVIPRPHLLIKKANLDFDIEDEKSAITEIQNLKLFIPSKKIYSKKNLIITDFKFENTNFNLQLDDIKDLRNHLYNATNKPINISKIKIFLKDEKENVILIVPIKKLNYQLNDALTNKDLKLNGSIFGIQFSSSWKTNLKNPKSSINEISLKKPNILIKNLFTFKNENNFYGSSSIDFLNENLSFNYNYNDQKIKIFSKNEKKNQKIKLKSQIELNPFYINGEIIFEEKKLTLFTDYLLNLIHNSDEEMFENLNGELKLVLSHLDNQLFEKGAITFSINEGSVIMKNAFVELNKIGVIKSNYNYIEKEDKLFFKTQNILNINSQKEFARKFQLNFKKIKKIKKIYFDLERNVDTGDIFLSNVYVNDKNSKNLLEEVIKTNNILILKSLLRDILS